jgi:hypothetical protein
MTTTAHPVPAHRARSAIGAMYAGLGLTVAVTLAAYVDQATADALASHLRSGYPTYTEARIDSAVTTYLVYLSVVGGLGAVCWLVAIWAVRTGKPWARGTATTMFGLGAGTAVFDLLVRDTSGDTGLPPLLGWSGLIPCLAGAVAVVRLWRRS